MAHLLGVNAVLMLASAVVQAAVSALPRGPSQQKTHQFAKPLMTQNPSAMLTELEEMVSSGEAPSFDTISTIKSTIQEDLMPDLQTTRDAADEDTANYLARIQLCNDESKTRAANIEATLQVSVNNARSVHAACRDVQKSMFHHNLTHTTDSYCVQLGHFLHGAKRQEILPGSSRHLAVTNVKEASSSNICGSSEVTELADKCAGVEAELSNKKAECSAKQKYFEEGFCMWKSALGSNCQTLDSCYSTALAAYGNHVARMPPLVEKWNVETAGLQKILCYCDVWLSAKDEGDNRSQHNATQFDVCQQRTHMPVSMNYGTPAAKVACPLNHVAIFPGRADFVTQEYGSFTDFIEEVIPCLESCISHGERVQLILGSAFSGESCACGTLSDTICSGGEWKLITWEDGNSFKYQHQDLESCVEASAYMAVKSRSASCSHITSPLLCASAACKLGLSWAGDKAKDDGHTSARKHDPPYCYFENKKLKFNAGTNTGRCGGYDTCVCKAP